MNLGFHVSISKGFKWTFREAQRLSCDAIQIFVKNPRSWTEKKWKDEEVAAFRELRTGMPVFAHLSYLPNLARIDEEEKNMKGFLNEIKLCLELGVNSMVVHCGSREDERKGIETTAAAINRALDQYDLNIITETAAGQRNAIGAGFQELAMIYDRVERKERVLLCIDTAHIFQYGCDIRKRETWEGIIKMIDGRFGRDKIGLFHLNDSKTDLGSRVDRHWHIGKGLIGTKAFGFILNDKRFAGLSGVMETPKTGRMDEINMNVMRSLLSPLMPGSSA
ncbi:MAG: deoxyribonuclease IV [Syntrophobacterales bacterium]|jgi:apurinic endonuclease APN1|nr:deoxyribonuclease IV [Syntrophobacterales bacterium]